jgi:hypothetical protein
MVIRKNRAIVSDSMNLYEAKKCGRGNILMKSCADPKKKKIIKRNVAQQADFIKVLKINLPIIINTRVSNR